MIYSSVTYMGVCAGKLGALRSSGRPRHICGDNIKMDLREIEGALLTEFVLIRIGIK
jgi:hypothetical protein